MIFIGYLLIAWLTSVHLTWGGVILALVLTAIFED